MSTEELPYEETLFVDINAVIEGKNYHFYIEESGEAIFDFADPTSELFEKGVEPVDIVTARMMILRAIDALNRY